MAIAQELYGDSSVPIHHDPENHTIVVVLRDRLLAHWRPYFPEERFPEGNSSGESIEHEPSHKNQQIATWVGWPEAEISTTSVVGEQPIASYLPFSAIPHSVVREGWTPGHYASEAAAIAAIRAAGTAGAVFLEQGRYVAYHTRDNALVFDFTWENICWEQEKPLTPYLLPNSLQLLSKPLTNSLAG
ncbi:MAG: hypothetical protein F6K32_14035 [Desertifilum sp. SIO1I2]|nr:hypothetical protein [Desertifilum sp. SIO1I2]